MIFFLRRQQELYHLLIHARGVSFVLIHLLETSTYRSALPKYRIANPPVSNKTVSPKLAL